MPKATHLIPYSPARVTASNKRKMSGQTKADKISEIQSNLPLPEQPPTASDWNSSDARTVNVGSGGISADVSASGKGATTGLREPASQGSGAREAGGADLSGIGGESK